MTPDTVVIMGPALSPPVMAAAETRGIRTVTMRPYERPDIARDLVEAEQPTAIIVRMGRLTRDIMAASGKLLVIVKHGVGVDTIDVDAATKRGIPVLIAPGANTRSVAEHALALMLSLARGVPELDRRMRSGHWDKATTTGIELFGKTLGVVGLGAIGRTLLSLAVPLGMKAVAYDPFVVGAGTNFPGLADLVLVPSLEALLREADIVSLHCPLTAGNRGMIGEAQFACMKPDAFLINTARGELVDPEALVRALSSGRIGGAGLDTFFPEPPAPDSPLWRFPNVVATPHIGAYTREAKERVGQIALGHVLDAIDGRPLNAEATVNKETLKTPPA